MANLSYLFEDTVRDIYYAEKAILKALPKMAKKATSQDLKAAFEKHREETEEQVSRLEDVFELLGKQPRGKKCPAIDGILEEGAELLEEHEPSEALDAGMAAAAQAVEHYEIARYGTLIAWATELGMSDAAKLLNETLEQEIATDEALSELATSSLNPAAREAGDNENSEDDEDDAAEMKPSDDTPKTRAKGKRRAA